MSCPECAARTETGQRYCEACGIELGKKSNRIFPFKSSKNVEWLDGPLPKEVVKATGPTREEIQGLLSDMQAKHADKIITVETANKPKFIWDALKRRKAPNEEGKRERIEAFLKRAEVKAGIGPKKPSLWQRAKAWWQRRKEKREQARKAFQAWLNNRPKPRKSNPFPKAIGILPYKPLPKMAMEALDKQWQPIMSEILPIHSPGTPNFKWPPSSYTFATSPDTKPGTLAALHRSEDIIGHFDLEDRK